MGILDPMIEELEREARGTLRLLERVPEDRLAWSPHDRAMSLGQLALHVAEIPGTAARMLEREEVGVPDFGDLPAPESRGEVLRALDESLETARSVLASMGDDRARSTLRLVDDGDEVLTMPRIAVLRYILLNHWYHHRGQLALYLRMLDVEVPATYGASADEVRMKAG